MCVCASEFVQSDEGATLCWIWQAELLWPVQLMSLCSPSQLSLLKHNQLPDMEKKNKKKTRKRVRIDLSLPIVLAYTGAEQEIKNS